MAIKHISIKENQLTGTNSIAGKLFSLRAYKDRISIDSDLGLIQVIEKRFWIKQSYEYKVSDVDSGEIEVVSIVTTADPETGIEYENYSLALYLYLKKGAKIELCEFICSRRILPDLIWFFIFWIPGTKKDTIDNGMDTAKSVSDFLTKNAGIHVKFPAYTSKNVYTSNP